MGVLKTCVQDSVIIGDGWRWCTDGKTTAVNLRLPRGISDMMKILTRYCRFPIGYKDCMRSGFPQRRLLKIQVVARHTVFLGKYLTVSGTALPSSSGSWLWRRRPCNFSKRWEAITLVPGIPFFPFAPAHYQVSGRCVGLTTLHLHVPIVLKSGSLNLLEPSGPVQACNRIILRCWVSKSRVPVFFKILFRTPSVAVLTKSLTYWSSY